jgi:hypothetical protein
MARWSELDDYLNHPTIGSVVALIKDGKPFIVSKNVVVLEYDFAKLANKVNIKSNQENIANILTNMLGEEVFVYAISRDERVRLVTAFNNLRQINRLPKSSEVNIDIKEIK